MFYINTVKWHIWVNIFCASAKQNLGRRFGTSKTALDAVRSKAVVLLLLIRC